MSGGGFRELVGFLESYRGHDAAIRLGTYVAMFLAGSTHAPWADKLRLVAREFGACRVILRMFDDATMWAVSLGYGLGKTEQSGTVRVMELVGNVVNTLFYPIEHLAWCGNKELLPLPGPLLSLGGLMLWAVSLITSIIKTVIRLSLLRKNMARVRKQRHLEKSEMSAEATEQNQELQKELRKLGLEQTTLTILLVQNLADLMNAINWMPPGILWSGRIPPRMSGVFGLISSLMMCRRFWPSKPKTA